MRVNFNKSEMIPMNLDDTKINVASQILNCPIGSFPIKYLGCPLHFNKLSRQDLQPLVYKLLKRMAGWSGNLLSLAARALLFKTCLSTIPV